MDIIRQTYDDLKKDKNVILEYIGSIDNSLLEKLLFDIEEKSESFGKSIKRRMFLISVELIQNLYAYTIKTQIGEINTDYCFILIMSNQQSDIEIITGNFVNLCQLETIIRKIEIVNSKTQEELNEYYRLVLNNNKRTEKGGAGLGIIDIKRKCEEKINYQQIYFDKNLYFFIFKIILKNK